MVGHHEREGNGLADREPEGVARRSEDLLQAIPAPCSHVPYLCTDAGFVEFEERSERRTLLLVHVEPDGNELPQTLSRLSGLGDFELERIPERLQRLRLDRAQEVLAEVPSLGPEDLSFNDMAQIMSDVLGKGVRFQQTTFEAYKDRFVSFGMSDAMAQGMTDMAWAKNEGIDNAVQRTPENSTPTSFRQWCEQVLKPAVAS